MRGKAIHVHVNDNARFRKRRVSPRTPLALPPSRGRQMCRQMWRACDSDAMRSLITDARTRVDVDGRRERPDEVHVLWR